MREPSPQVLEGIQEAASVCRNAAQATMDTILEFDEKSILKIDGLISRGWNGGLVGEQTIQVWGCFLGEAMRCTLNGKWVQTEVGLGIMVGNHVAHPLSKIEKRFSSGEAESISFFYSTFKKMLESGSDSL